MKRFLRGLFVLVAALPVSAKSPLAPFSYAPMRKGRFGSPKSVRMSFTNWETSSEKASQTCWLVRVASTVPSMQSRPPKVTSACMDLAASISC